MHLSREIAGGNGEILELRIGGENVTAHRQMKTHSEALISAGEEKNIQNQLEPTSFCPLKKQLVFFYVFYWRKSGGNLLRALEKLVHFPSIILT